MAAWILTHWLILRPLLEKVLYKSAPLSMCPWIWETSFKTLTLEWGPSACSLSSKNLVEMPARRPLPRRTDVQARVWDLLCRHRGHFEWGWDGDERTGSWEPFLLKFFIANYYSVLVPPRPLSLELGAKWQGALSKMSSLMLSLSL